MEEGGRREDGWEVGGEGEAAESKGEEGALLRLPLSFRCCAVQRQEGVLRGGVWRKKGGKERERRRERECLGSTATAAAACQDEGRRRREEG